jgi:hypothetical protein
MGAWDEGSSVVGANVIEQIAVSKAEADRRWLGRGNDLHLGPATLECTGCTLAAASGALTKIIWEKD